MTPRVPTNRPNVRSGNDRRLIPCHRIASDFNVDLVSTAASLV